MRKIRERWNLFSYFITILFCIIIISVQSCRDTEKSPIIKSPFTVQFFGTNIDLCELHQIYQRSNDSLYIEGSYIPVRNYQKIISEDILKEKSCTEIIDLVSKKYRCLEKSLIIQDYKNNQKIIGIGLIFDFSKTEFYELSLCFDNKEYIKLDKKVRPNCDSIVSINFIEQTNNKLAKVTKLEVIQCLLIK